MQCEYPINWPVSQERTPYDEQITSKFQQYGFQNLLDKIDGELSLLGAENAVFSSDQRIKADGRPYAAVSRSDDSGIAVYFDYNGSRHVMALDQYKYMWENMRGLAATINAIRGIERWGGSKIMHTAVSSFRALPAGSDNQKSWWVVLGVPKHALEYDVKSAYYSALKLAHPDVGGTAEQAQEIINAFNEYKAANK